MVNMSAALLDGIHRFISAHREILCILRVLHRIHAVTYEPAFEDYLIREGIFIAVEVYKTKPFEGSSLLVSDYPCSDRAIK